jgi:hypothetical protein
MKLTQERMARYLRKQKQVNSYLLKVTTIDRDEILRLTRIRCKLLEAEQEMRELMVSLGARTK